MNKVIYFSQPHEKISKCQSTAKTKTNWDRGFSPNDHKKLKEIYDSATNSKIEYLQDEK